MAATRPMYLLINGAEYELAHRFEQDSDHNVRVVEGLVQRLTSSGQIPTQQVTITTRHGDAQLFIKPEHVATVALVLGPAPVETPMPRKARSGEQSLATVGF